MGKFNLDSFLTTLTQGALGHMQGQQMAQQQTEQERQQQYAALMQDEQQKEARAAEERNVLLGIAGKASPAGQATIYQGVTNDLANRKPSPYTAAGMLDYKKTGQLPTAPPAAAPAPQTAPDVRTAVTMGAPQPTAAPAAAGAATGTPTLNTRYGAVPLGGGVPKERLARIQANLKTAQATYQNLPEGDPRRVQIQGLVDSLNLNPQTEAEADETERRLNQVNFNYGGAGRGLQAAAGQDVRAWNKEAPTRWAALRTADPNTLVDQMLQFAQESRDAEASGKSVGVKARPPLAFSAEKEQLARLEAAVADEDMEAATQIVAEIQSRMRPGALDARQVGSRVNSWLDYTKRLSSRNPQESDRLSAEMAQKLGITEYIAGGGKGLFGAELDKQWNQALNSLTGVAKLDPKTQRLRLNDMRSLAKLKGMDPDQIPAQVFESLDEKDRLTIAQMQRNEKRDAERWRQEQAADKRAQEKHDAEMAKLANGGAKGVSQQQTMAAYFQQWQAARAATKAAYGTWTQDELIWDPKTRTVKVADYLKSMPGIREAAQKVEDARKKEMAKEAAYNDYFNKVKAPPGRPAPVTTPQAGAVTQAKPRSYYFAALKKRHPNATAAQINATLDAKGVR